MNSGGEAAHQHLANGGTNGDTNHIEGPVVQQIIAALQIIHNPQSANRQRAEAGEFLEQAKADGKAPLHGFTLASDQSQIPAVRHYGLGLLAHAIRYNWLDYGESESTMVREWVVQLAKIIQPGDPSYLRNKVAQLWVDVARKSWGSEWMNMDFNLMELWDADLMHRELAMYIMESLVDEIFNREDSQQDPRTVILHRSCIDIFTSYQVLTTAHPSRDNNSGIRCGNEGWLARLVLQLQECLNNGIADAKAEGFAVQVLSTIRSCMPWVIARAVIEASVVDTLGRAMMSGNAQLRVIAIEALNHLFQREFIDDSDFKAIVGPLYESGTVRELRNILASINLEADGPDEDLYLFLKRFAEVIVPKL